MKHLGFELYVGSFTRVIFTEFQDEFKDTTFPDGLLWSKDHCFPEKDIILKRCCIESLSA